MPSSPAPLSVVQPTRRYGLLAANTSDGRITVFRYNAPAKDAEPVLDLAKCWEAQPPFSVRGSAWP